MFSTIEDSLLQLIAEAVVGTRDPRETLLKMLRIVPTIETLSRLDSQSYYQNGAFQSVRRFL
jgi:hypothetical protein